MSVKARLRFHGAAQEVTGSMHVVEADGHVVALDCGMFQGRRKVANEKNRSFPLPPEKLDAVVLSHAHIDHCGKLPRLVREGFEGPIFATPATCDLVRVMLADSAHIQEEDAFYWNKKRIKRGDAPIEPLYVAADVERTVPLLQARPLDGPFEVVPGLRARFHEAGHMLGSAGIGLEIDTANGSPTRVTFTGDLGRPGMAILRDPAPLPACDYLISESTYGGRNSPRSDDTRDRLADAVNDTIARRGKVIIPAFAVGRTQAIVYHFHQLVDEGRIPQHVPLVVDSPLARRATEIYKNHTEVYDREAAAFRRRVGHVLECDRCEYTQNVDESKALHGRTEPMVIVSASGMCEAGRILHHLKNNVEERRNTILIVGYQAAHTLGRRLVEKQKQIRIFGEMYHVRADVRVLNGFSAHADASELATMLVPLASAARRAFLVHGEMDQSTALAATLQQQGFGNVAIPAPGDTCDLHSDL